MQPDQNDDHIRRLSSMIGDKFDTIIQLLTEINSKLTQREPMSITTSKPKRIKKLTEQQKLHQAAVEGLTKQRLTMRKHVLQ